MDGTDAPVAYLFPELCEQVRKAGANALSDPERHALIAKYLRWFRKLARAQAKRLASQGRPAEVEDVEGEAFLAASEAAQFYRPEIGVQFGTFATAWIARHFARTYDARLAVPAVGLEFPDRQVAREDGPEEAADPEPDEEGRRLLNNLPEPTRTIVRLSVFARLSPGRIADQLGMSLKDVRLELRNAAAKLGRAVAVGEAMDCMSRASGN